MDSFLLLASAQVRLSKITRLKIGRKLLFFISKATSKASSSSVLFITLRVKYSLDPKYPIINHKKLTKTTDNKNQKKKTKKAIEFFKPINRLNTQMVKRSIHFLINILYILYFYGIGVVLSRLSVIESAVNPAIKAFECKASLCFKINGNNFATSSGIT